MKGDINSRCRTRRLPILLEEEKRGEMSGLSEGMPREHPLLQRVWGLPYQRRRYAIMLYELSLVGVAVILIVALFIAAFAAS
jgi:hypothetical protein